MKRPQLLHANNNTVDTSVIQMHTESINKCARVNSLIKEAGCMVILRHADNLYEVYALWGDWDNRWLNVQVKLPAEGKGKDIMKIIRVPWHTHFTVILD